MRIVAKAVAACGAVALLGMSVWFSTAVTAGVVLMNSLLPNIIIGERLSALGWIALFLFVLPLGVLAILLHRAGP